MNPAQWIYEKDDHNRFRYVLGVKGQNMIAVLGANPSTAVPGAPDRTVNRISKFVKAKGFDGWVVFNLCPQIATDPNKLNSAFHPASHTKNLKVIGQAFQQYPIQAVWAAWGNLIEKRDYLVKSLGEITELPPCKQIPWVQLDPPTGKGHPRHPLYHPSGSKLNPFKVREYLKTL